MTLEQQFFAAVADMINSNERDEFDTHKATVQDLWHQLATEYGA